MDGVVEAGYHAAQWDGKSRSGRVAAPGMYLYRMQAMAVKTGEFHQLRKMVLIK